MISSLPSSTTPTMTPDPVMPCIQAGSTFRSLSEGPLVMEPVFSYKSEEELFTLNTPLKSYPYRSFDKSSRRARATWHTRYPQCHTLTTLVMYARSYMIHNIPMTTAYSSLGLWGVHKNPFSPSQLFSAAEHILPA